MSDGYLIDHHPTKRSLFVAGAIDCQALHSRIQEGPVQLHGRADSWKASGVLDSDMKVHGWP